MSVYDIAARTGAEALQGPANWDVKGSCVIARKVPLLLAPSALPFRGSRRTFPIPVAACVDEH
jgi:hypothetical protein